MRVEDITTAVGIVGFALVFQGLRYLLAVEYMPYHALAVGAPWDDLAPLHQTLILGLLRGFGAGALAVGLAVLGLVVGPLRAGVSWARPIAAGVALLYTGSLVYVTAFALLPWARPTIVSVFLCALTMAAAVGSYLEDRGNR